ncbi:MAG: hypothetical protein EOM22_10450 [Gammaproteobacteria bacterium]|jgi:hypothetical protein|nr:hypothetical protein [Gammaproteobacteria bacterium]
MQNINTPTGAAQYLCATALRRLSDALGGSQDDFDYIRRNADDQVFGASRYCGLVGHEDAYVLLKSVSDALTGEAMHDDPAAEIARLVALVEGKS